MAVTSTNVVLKAFGSVSPGFCGFTRLAVLVDWVKKFSRRRLSALTCCISMLHLQAFWVFTSLSVFDFHESFVYFLQKTCLMSNPFVTGDIGISAKWGQKVLGGFDSSRVNK